MADQLNPCVKSILCALSTPVLNAIQGIISAQKAVLQTQIAAIQLQLLQYDLAALPIEAANAAAQTMLSQVKQVSTLVPLNMVAECLDLGTFNQNLVSSLDFVSAYASQMSFEAIEFLTYRDELNGIIAKMNNTIDQFDLVNDVIDQCKASA